MTRLNVTVKDFYKPRFGIAPQAWISLCLWKMRIEEREMVQVQSLEWPSGYVGFECIPPRMEFAKHIRYTLEHEEWNA